MSKLNYFYLLFICHFPIFILAQDVNIDSDIYTQKELIVFLEKGFKENDLTLQGKAYFLLARKTQAETGNMNVVIEYLLKSQDIFGKINDKEKLCRTKLFLSELYLEQKMFDKAIELQTEALSYYQSVHDLSLETHTLTYLNAAYSEKKDTQKSNYYKALVLEKNKILKDTVLAINFLLEDITTLQYAEKYEEALVLVKKMRVFAKNNRPLVFIPLSYFYEGLMLQFTGKNEAAINTFKEAVKQLSDAGTIRQCYLHLAQCHVNLNDFKNAYFYENKYNILNNSILDKEKAASFQRLSLQYDSEGKKKEIIALEQDKKEALWQRNISIAMGVGLLFLLSGGLALWYFYHQKRQSEIIISQQKEQLNQQKINDLEQKIQISNIQAILKGQEIERERIAKDLHDSLGGMLSTVRLQFDALPTKNIEQQKTALELLDTTIREVRNIARNLQPDALVQFGLNAAVKDLVTRLQGHNVPIIDFQHYGKTLTLDPTRALSIFRIIQELLHNAIKHANASEILLQLIWTESTLTILVEDDGIGYNPVTIKQGMGTQNIKTRIDYLHADLNIQSEKEKGTSIEVNIPLD